ncbi:MAG: esterase family protein [Hungatella sp.]|nr:esterase family protein [Hungatella sp.]
MSYAEVKFYSETLHMDTGIGVILPQEVHGIGVDDTVRLKEFYPVLWLLHGRSDDHTIWMRRTSIERYASPFGLMVVMPEVSFSRYLNMVHGPRYEDYLTIELPRLCKQLFPNMSTKREDNYIAGLSMGGGGAMWAGLHHPDRYGTICMLSTGGVAPLEGLWRKTGGGDLAYQKCSRSIYGVEDTDSLEGTEYDILKIIRDTARIHRHLPKVYHAMGTEDIRYPAAMKIKETFESIPGNPYDYEYHEGPGSHEWGFWDQWIKNFLNTVMRKGDD